MYFTYLFICTGVRSRGKIADYRLQIADVKNKKILVFLPLLCNNTGYDRGYLR